jgi:SAM-dependent methyltransferase
VSLPCSDVEIHHAAALGFERGADAYERGRPSYPAAAVDWLAERCGIGPGMVVVDLAAGTGKLTRALADRGAQVVAVEPVAAMRTALARVMPGVRVLDGVAEELPLTDAAADVVTVGQAFHWFRAAPALAEIHRVLRPGGHLALIWNRRDESRPLQAAIGRMIEPHRGDTPRHSPGGWADAFIGTPLFGPLQEHHVPFEQEVDEQGLVDRVLSTSVVASLPDEERDRVEAQVRDLAAATPRPIRLAYNSDVFVTRRR